MEGAAGWGPEQLHGDFERCTVSLRLQAAQLRKESVDATVQQLVIAVEICDRRFELVDLPGTESAVSMLSEASAVIRNMHTAMH